MFLRIVLAFVVVLLGAGHPERLRAQANSAFNSEPGESAPYREAVSRALQEYELRNYEEAREQFRVAHELEPSARTFRGLGVTEFELRNYPESVRYLEQALASQVKPLTGTIREQVSGVLDRARGYVGEVNIELRPANARVTLDGQPLELDTRPLLLAVGDHTLEFSATGHATQRRSLTVKGRKRETLFVELTAIPSVAASESAPPPSYDEREPASQPAYRKWWVWTSVGVVVAAAGVTTALLVRRSRDVEYQDRPMTTPNVPSGYRSGLPLPDIR